MLVSEMREIFERYDIVPEMDIEHVLWEKIQSGQFVCSLENLSRVIRFCTMNKQMKKQGLEPLTLVDVEKPLEVIVEQRVAPENELEKLRDELRCKVLDRDVLKEDVEIAGKYGLSKEEYLCVYGIDNDMFLDLKLDKTVCCRLLERLKDPVIQNKYDTDKELIQYCIRKLVLMAKRRWRCPECIPSLQNIYADTIRLIRILRRK